MKYRCLKLFWELQDGFYIMNCLYDKTEDIQETHDIGREWDLLNYEGLII